MASPAVKPEAQLQVLVPVADGTEDIELACITDTLVRANLKPVVASVMPGGRTLVRLARQLLLVTETHIDNIHPSTAFAAVVIPGGMPGASTIANNTAVIRLLKTARASNAIFAAVCAAPAVVLAPHGLLEGVQQATCYPALRDKLPASVTWKDEPVVECGNCITSQGPATSLLFALAIVRRLRGAAVADEVGKALLVPQAKL